MKEPIAKDSVQSEDIHAEKHKYVVRLIEDEVEAWKKLQLDLKYWKMQLRLDDVDIDMRWMEWHEYPERLAQFDDLSLVHLFIVAFRKPHHKCSMATGTGFNSDYEVCLVHELLHIRNHRWYCEEVKDILDEGVNNSLYEVSLDATAEALVRARRGITR